MTPFLTARTATISLVIFCAVYSLIFAFGVFYVNRLLRAGPAGRLVLPPSAAIPNRPMSVVDGPIAPSRHHPTAGE
jgi:cytochrome d ubiquinol oxidase subunit I